MALLVADRSGNAATFPSVCPSRDHPFPRMPVARTHAGVTIRRLAAAPPLAPVRAGAVATVFVDARGERYAWALRRLGDPRCSCTAAHTARVCGCACRAGSPACTC